MPVTAWVSILHRFSGVLLFISLPMLLMGMEALYESQASFDRLARWLVEPWTKILAFILLSAFIYHFAAGLRYLLFDLHIGTRRSMARRSAIAVLLATLVGTALVIFGTQ